MKVIHSAAMRSLPPFDALIAFDTTLRHRSMSLAAAELGVTQSAISHRLRRLEAFFGTRLLRRSGSGIDATPEGAALAAGLSELLDGLADLHARCRAAVAPAALRVGVGAAFADYWLVRRLPRFAASHPGMAVELAILNGSADLPTMEVDVELRWLPVANVRTTSTQRLLFAEQVFPVCHPSLLPGRRFGDPGVLADLPLLHKGPAGHDSGAEWSWQVWFARLGINSPPTNGLRFDSIATAIAAALQGAGVVLARSLLVHDALAEGRLFRVLPPSFDMPSSKAHVVRWPGALLGDPRVGAFVSWVIAEASLTTGASDAPAARSAAS
jgi:LysR family glycine cleavage system transcriptional activator